MQATETVLTLPAVKIKLLRIAARKIAIMQRIPAATKTVQNQCLITSKKRGLGNQITVLYKGVVLQDCSFFCSEK